LLRKTFSGIMLSLLLIGSLILMFNVEPVAPGNTIYIRPDGSVDPPTAPISTIDNVTYTLTGNINDSIVVERNSIVVDGVGFTVQGSGIRGIDLSYRSNVTIKDMNIRSFIQAGVFLWCSLNNSIFGNNITANYYGGIIGYNSNYSGIFENNVANNGYGIYLYESSDHNSIFRNTITANGDFGIWPDYSSNNDIYENTIAGNNKYGGIRLRGGLNNSIFGNNIVNNEYGMYLLDSSNNTVYHNNFTNSTQQIYDGAWDYPTIPPSINTWDDGYPSGGNYWSDYSDVDLYSGPYQNETGSDGIWDHPYVIDENNQDRYPFVNPWTPPENQPPIVSFTYTPRKPIISEEIIFNASASFDPDGHIVSYEWSFDDGNIAYGEIVSHSYSVARDHTVTLTVTDNEGATNSTSMTVKVTKDWTFAIITDLHIGYCNEDYGTVGFDDDTGSGDYYWLTDRLDGIVRWINDNEEAYNIHFVVVLGDISDSGEKSELLRAREFLNKLNVPYIPVIGNHDVWPYTQEAKPLVAWRDLRKTGFPLYTINEWAGSAVGDQFFEEAFWQQNKENVEKIKALFGDSWKRQVEQEGYTGRSFMQNYVFTYKGVKFIPLDFVDREPGNPPESGAPKLYPETEVWLGENLKEGEQTILLSHHPIIESPFDFSYNDMVRMWTAAGYGWHYVLANFAGHNHDTDEVLSGSYMYGYFKVMTTEAVCRESTLFPRGFVSRTGNNIRIVRISGEKMDYDTLRSIGDKTQDILINWKIWAKSPVDLIVTDPEGFTLTKEVGEVAGMLYMEFDWDGDGELDDLILLSEAKVGDYQITVVPEPNTSLTDTYTLMVLGMDAAIVLAENVSITDIPTDPYIVSSTAFTLNIPPTTLLDIGEPKFMVNDTAYLTSVTPIELIANDNLYGSGLSSTAYKIYNATYNTGWIIYMQPFYLTRLSDGIYHIDYNSTDIAGNIETTNTIAVTLTNHNIAITSITFSNPSPKHNETITIYVTVENRGNFTETFDTSVNYTILVDPLIGTQTITLEPGATVTLNFTWTPTAAGRYEIKAYTSVIPNDINPSDNTAITYIYVTSSGTGGISGGSHTCLLT